MAIRSGNYNGLEVFGASALVSLVVYLNLITLYFLTSRLFEFEVIDLIYNKIRFLLVFIVLLIIWMYYKFQNRYLKVVSKYDTSNKFNVLGFIVFFIYYFTSGALALISAMYKNHDWIFK